MMSWQEGGRQSSGNMSDGRMTQSATELSQTSSAEKSFTSGMTNDVQKQPYMMSNSHQYPPPFHGPMPPPYLAMRPGIKPPAMGRLPFHMGHMPMMPPNYNALMMNPFVPVHICSAVCKVSNFTKNETDFGGFVCV